MITKNTISNKLKTKKHSLQFLPKAVEELTKEKYIFYNGKKLKTAYIVDIIHNLLLRYYFKKENIFNLSSLILKEKYGHIYNYYMEYLVFTKVIYVVKKHMIGKNARVYKISQNIIDDQIFRFKNEDTILLKKYKKAVSQIDNSDILTNSILPEIKQKIVADLFNINIEYDKAMYFLNNTKQDIDSFNKNKYSVEAIRDKHIFYHFDNFGRFHTNFTILKSFIRKNCLLINGEETLEIDTPNSQPLFLCKLIKDNDCGIVNSEEYNLYKILTFTGVFYQYIIDNSDIKDKNECKEIIYRVLFGHNNNSKGNLIFKKLFPTIFKFIKSYKKEMGNYKMLAHDLQKAESNFIFNKVIKTIMIINPDISLITIHDSIVYPIQHQDIINKVFDSKLKEEIGYL